MSHLRRCSIAALAWLVGAPLIGRAQQAPPDYRISLQSRQFVPPEDVSYLATIQARPPGEHVIVQFHADPDDGQRALIADAIHLLAPLSDAAWLAFVSSTVVLDDHALAVLRAVVPLEPTDRLAPDLARGDLSPLTVNPDGSLNLVVEFFPDVPDAEQASAIAAEGGRVLSAVEGMALAVATLPGGALSALAADDRVLFIRQPDPPMGPENDQTRRLLGVDVVQGQVTGLGVTAMIYDGGRVDAGHEDLSTRVTVMDAEPTSDHATHVAGIFAADGRASDEQYRGMAPDARLLSYTFTRLPTRGGRSFIDNLGDMRHDFLDAIRHGAVLGNMSLGYDVTFHHAPCALEGDYTAGAQILDQVVYERGFTLSKSASNQRGEGCDEAAFPPPYPPGFQTLSPPAPAKNPIVVGASKSDDDSMVSFSSWGPTDDGRIKPDVMAPGCQSWGDVKQPPPLPLYDWSSPDTSIWSTMPRTSADYPYGGMCGTSMAAPAVGGSAALLFERFRALFGRDPRPASVKALLVDGAHDLFRMDGGGCPWPVCDGPDFTTGFGRIDTLRSMEKLNDRQIVENRIVRAQQIFPIPFDVAPGASHVRVTLAWDDPPRASIANTERQLVNDLDLVLVDPLGNRHVPWLLNPANPDAAARRDVVCKLGDGLITSCDGRNNVEVVEVTDGVVPGPWRAEVIAYSVTQRPQRFSVASVRRADCLFDANGDGLPEWRLLDTDGDGWCELPDRKTVIRGVLRIPAGTTLEFHGRGYTTIEADAIVIEDGGARVARSTSAAACGWGPRTG